MLFFNWDINACINILYLTNKWLEKRSRPVEYKRDDPNHESGKHSAITVLSNHRKSFTIWYGYQSILGRGIVVSWYRGIEEQYIYNS